MKNEEKWIDNLRNRMEGYSEPLPDGLWDTLSKELEEKKVPKVIPIWRRWQVAAAVLVLLASSLTYWFWSSPKADFRNQKMAADMLDTPLPEKETSLLQEQIAKAENPVAEKSETENLRGVSPRSMTAVAALALREEMRPDTILSEETIVDDIKINSEEERELKEENPQKSQTEEAYSRQLKKKRSEDRERMAYNAREAKYEKKKSSGFSLGVGAGNMPYSSLNTFNGMGSFVARSAYYTSPDLNMAPIGNGGLAYSQVLLENAIQTPSTSVKHHVPVTVGATVAWHFHENWALETGLNYTLLTSDIRSGSKSYVEETQKLHYIGIPVKLHRSIWKNSWLSLYASAGGAVEKCVSGRLETVTVTNGGNRTSECTSLDVDPLQWSLTAAAGAQVNFTSRFGVYVEPGIAYYFDDHSGVETIRKEHPLNFNLQLGLRVNVTK